MRQFYTALFYGVLPVIVARLLWKSRNQPAYRHRVGERLGFYRDGSITGHPIWFHAVSVGECEAAFPVIKAIRQQLPAIPILVTCTTPTGSSRIRKVLGDSVSHVYLPYDLPDAVNRFLRHFQPRLGVIMETEIWPNLFQICGERQIPLMIVNGRISQKSVRGYSRVRALVQASLAAVVKIAAQTEADAERYLTLGADPARVGVTGNVKFDIEFDADMRTRAAELRRALFQDRPVWIAGSTHPGEEEILLDALAQVGQSVPGIVLIIAPRHPERSPQIRRLCEGRGLTVQSRSEGEPCRSDTRIFLIDGIGELRLFYGLADVAFIGGSLIPHGGQNVLEAASAGLPVIFGPYMMNFQAISLKLKASGAGIEVVSADALAEWISRFLLEPEMAQEYGRKGRAFVDANRGAVDRTVRLIRDQLASAEA